MVTPLHVNIALHYHTSVDQWPDLRIPIHERYANDLVNYGLLEKDPSHVGPFCASIYRKTPALAVWIEALCSVPFPVQQWVIPKSSPDHPEHGRAP